MLRRWNEHFFFKITFTNIDGNQEIQTHFEQMNKFFSISNNSGEISEFQTKTHPHTHTNHS